MHTDISPSIIRGIENHSRSSRVRTTCISARWCGSYCGDLLSSWHPFGLKWSLYGSCLFPCFHVPCKYSNFIWAIYSIVQLFVFQLNFLAFPYLWHILRTNNPLGCVWTAVDPDPRIGQLFCSHLLRYPVEWSGKCQCQESLANPIPLWYQRKNRPHDFRLIDRSKTHLNPLKGPQDSRRTLRIESSPPGGVQKDMA
jgi:hypothetical protein